MALRLTSAVGDPENGVVLSGAVHDMLDLRGNPGNLVVIGGTLEMVVLRGCP